MKKTAKKTLTYEDKLNAFRKGCLAFQCSDKGPEASFRFAMKVWEATQFGSGLTFGDVEDVIYETVIANAPACSSCVEES